MAVLLDGSRWARRSGREPGLAEQENGARFGIVASRWAQSDRSTLAGRVTGSAVLFGYSCQVASRAGAARAPTPGQTTLLSTRFLLLEAIRAGLTIREAC